MRYKDNEQLSFMVHKDAKILLQKIAHDQGLNPSIILRQLLNNYLEEEIKKYD